MMPLSAPQECSPMEDLQTTRGVVPALSGAKHNHSCWMFEMLDLLWIMRVQCRWHGSPLNADNSHKINVLTWLSENLTGIE